jgi:hypothetical protein
MTNIDLSNIAREPQTSEDLVHTTRVLVLPATPLSVEELAQHLGDLGCKIARHDFEYAGERSSGHLDLMSLDGVKCILKFSGDPEADMYIVYQAGVQTERDGLVLMSGYAPRLVAEVRVDGEVVAVFREFIEEGNSLAIELAEERLSKDDVLVRAEEVALKLTDSGLRLYDPSLDNFWLLPNGTVIIIDGQCAVPSDEDRDALRAHNMKIVEGALPA